jgi:Phytanoyl-CoA dioxygenase (PhyH)
MKLSDQQLNFFQTFGYLAFRGLFAGEIGTITNVFEEIWQEHGGGHAGRAHDGKARSALAQFIDQDARLSALLDDPRVKGIASSLLGDDFNFSGSDGNYYVGDTRWHSDGWHRNGILHIKMALYLDSVTAETGCLRVIPGSFLPDDQFSSALQSSVRLIPTDTQFSDPQSSEGQGPWGVRGRDLPAVALESEPGDLLVFNHNIKHASFGGGARRRMFTMNLCQHYPDERLPELREMIGGGARFWIERAYGEVMVQTAGPERMRHLEQFLANDGHLAELSRKARESMAEPARG